MTTQRIGLTDITVVYHRPQVRGRAIFGAAVPYGRVWRAGANDNTTIEFGDPVTVEGRALPAGKYGLHMIPNRTEWTVIFSRNSMSWGSFTYDPIEDALRVTIAPQPIPLRETLTFEFPELQSASGVMQMAWERVAIPIRIAVDTRSITIASLKNELRHLPGFKGEAFLDAALYCVDKDFSYPQALAWIDRSIKLDGERFENLDLKAQILEELGRPEAAEVKTKALKLKQAGGR